MPVVHLSGADVDAANAGHPTEGIPYGGFRDYSFTNRQRGAALWYHDHTLGRTGERVHKGLAGLYLLSDPAQEAHLRLPKGRFEVPLIIADRAFEPNGELLYSLNDNLREHGLFGDMILVNGVIQPFFQVATAKYRFRVLNASNARTYLLALDDGGPLIQIGTDGGLLQRPVLRQEISLSPGERLDLIVDFSDRPVGTKIVLENRYGTDRTASIMRFDVSRRIRDTGRVPDFLAPWEELPESESIALRTFNLYRRVAGGRVSWTINDNLFQAGQAALANPALGSIECWRFINHTVHEHVLHPHLVQCQIIEIGGEPVEPSEYGWKDTLVIPPLTTLTAAARFGSHPGRYVIHSRTLEYEDFGMLGEFEVIPTPV